MCFYFCASNCCKDSHFVLFLLCPQSVVFVFFSVSRKSGAKIEQLHACNFQTSVCGSSALWGSCSICSKRVHFATSQRNTTWLHVVCTIQPCVRCILCEHNATEVKYKWMKRFSHVHLCLSFCPSIAVCANAATSSSSRKQKQQDNKINGKRI